MGSMVVGFSSAYTSPALVSMLDRNITDFEVTSQEVSSKQMEFSQQLFVFGKEKENRKENRFGFPSLLSPANLPSCQIQTMIVTAKCNYASQIWRWKLQTASFKFKWKIFLITFSTRVLLVNEQISRFSALCNISSFL
jgi:hypothetical protein